MSWDADDLFNKGKSYLHRALESERDSPLYPFWSTLALEHFGRAVVAQVSPALLADPTQGESVLYAFGLASAGKTVPSKTVFARCQRIVPTLSNNDFDFVMSMMERRNAELHTGEAAFDILDPGIWEHPFFHVVQLLVEAFGQPIDQVVTPDHAGLVNEILTANRDAVVGEVKKRLNVCREHFALKTDEDIGALRDATSKLLPRSTDKKIQCPACESPAIIEGESRVTKAPVLKNTTVLVETVCLPTGLTCTCCGLRLDSYAQVEAAGCGGTFAVVFEEDAITYYGEQYLEGMEYEPDYGND